MAANTYSSSSLESMRDELSPICMMDQPLLNWGAFEGFWHLVGLKMAELNYAAYVDWTAMWDAMRPGKRGRWMTFTEMRPFLDSAKAHARADAMHYASWAAGQSIRAWEAIA